MRSPKWPKSADPTGRAKKAMPKVAREASVAVALHQKCFKPYSYVVVDYKGGVGPCNHLIADENWKQMGALGRSSFAEIWNSPAYHDMRRKLLNALPDNGACRWCFAHRMAD